MLSGSGVALPGAALLGAAALVLAYAALGPLTRGLRNAGEYIGSAPLLPQPVGVLLFQHLIVPGLCATGLAAIGAGCASLLGAGSLVPALAAAAGAAILALLLRLAAAVKGTLPMSLLAPIPTEFGDLSVVSVVLWSLDGIIWAVLLGGVLGMFVRGVPLAAAGLALLAGAAFVLWSRHRLRAGVESA